VTEVFFYHLQSQPLEAALPTLVERSLERGWRAVVQMSSPERLSALDAHFWTFRDDSFLPHAPASEKGAADQPVLLTTDEQNLNGAAIRFLIDGALLPADSANYQRIVLMFDGNDDDAAASAREQWKVAKAAGHTVTYWQQDPAGRWQQKA
jgi:DNA polymerase III subunit chi